MFKNKVVKNASWIIACKVIQSILTLVVTMFTARYLGPSNFGLINYAASVAAFVSPIALLGISNILVQEIVDDYEHENEIVGTSIILSLSSAVICMFGVYAFASIANRGDTEAIIVCALYSIMLVFQSIELVQYWFHAKLLSKYVSIVALFAYCVYSGYRIFLLSSGKNIYWFALSNALDKLIISTILIIFFNIKRGRPRFSASIARRILAKSKYYILADLMVVVFAQTDKIMLKSMLGNRATGLYSAAVACACLGDFVFAAIYDSTRPIIFEAKKENDILFKTRITQLFSVITYISLFYSIAITTLAPIIISIIYGKQYIEASNALRLAVWFTAFSNYGVVRNIWLLAEGKQKHLLKINVSGALINVIMNYFTIPLFGIMGAAFSSLFAQFFTNVITGYIFKDISEVNKYMMKGLNPNVALGLVKNRRIL